MPWAEMQAVHRPCEMPETLFRYFREREHAEQFLEGAVRFNALSVYRNFEDGQVRGDENEGRMTFGPEGGLDLTKDDGTKIQGFRFYNCDVTEDDIFVYCLSLTPSDQKAEGFGLHCVEIFDVGAFLQRVADVLPQRAVAYPLRVTYDDPREPPGARWACPELIAASKWPAFAWQDEYRLLFSLTNALDFQNSKMTVSQQLAIRPRRTGLPDPISLRVPSGFRDICRARPPS